MKLKTKICSVCGKEYSYYPSAIASGEKFYCSRACRSRASRIDTNCPLCGKAFWYYRSWPRKYCSRKCSAAVNAKANLGIVELGRMNCEICGKEITGQKWEGRKFCSRKCFAQHLAVTLKGVPRPNVRGPKPHLYKRVDKYCDQCGRVFAVKQSHASRRRFCSKQCMARWQAESGEMSGSQNPNWSSGSESYYGPNWLRQRRVVRARDHYTCQRCGITEDELGRELDVHHIRPFRFFGIANFKRANRAENLVSLCNRCHLRIEHEEGKRPNPPRIRERKNVKASEESA